MLIGGQTTDSLMMDSTTANTAVISEAAETTPVAVATIDAVMSTDGDTAAVSTSNQPLTYDVSSSLMQSVTTGYEATATEFTTTLTETTTTTTIAAVDTRHVQFFDTDRDDRKSDHDNRVNDDNNNDNDGDNRGRRW